MIRQHGCVRIGERDRRGCETRVWAHVRRDRALYRPFVDSNGTLSQPVQTGVTNGGKPLYFNVIIGQLSRLRDGDRPQRRGRML